MAACFVTHAFDVRTRLSPRVLAVVSGSTPCRSGLEHGLEQPREPLAGQSSRDGTGGRDEVCSVQRVGPRPHFRRRRTADARRS